MSAGLDTTGPSPVPYHLRKNVLAGLMFIAVAALGLFLSRNYPVGTALRMGTGYVPRLLCWVLGGLGVLTVVQGVLVPGESVISEDASSPWRPIAFVTLSILIFAFTIETLGVVIATALLVVIGALAGRDLRPLEVALTGIVLIVLTVATFVWGLGLTIPIWPEW
jgi:putative tricarboxylic transport membrane protein